MDNRDTIEQAILSLCEDIEYSFKKAQELPEYNGSSSYYCRLNKIKEKIETERRIIEEISLPCRLVLEHFSLFLGKWDYTVGFKFGKIQTGRGLLTDIHVAEWGNVTLAIGNAEIVWRDADYQYLFYPDKVVLRPKDIGKSDIYLYFSYSFKYGTVLEKFQDVFADEQTSYWHEELNILADAFQPQE